jgi:hypothetical protein
MEFSIALLRETPGDQEKEKSDTRGIHRSNYIDADSN